MRNNLKKNITAILTLLLLSAMGMGIQLTIPTVSATYGDSRWSFAMVEDNINGPEYANGVVFCGSAEDVLYAVNSTDGEQVWNVTLGGDVSGKPWVEGSTIYVTDNSRLYALSTTSGSQLWNYTASGFNNANPIYDNGVIYVLQITGGRIHAVNATTGAQIWNVTTGGSAYYLGHEAFGDDALFIGRTDGTMAAFEMSTGAQRWSVEINNVDGIYAWADYEDGSVFVQTSNMTGWSLDSVDGGVNWSYDFPVGDWVESSGAAEYNGVVCFNVMNGGDGVIYGINATSGVYLWNYTISGITLSIPFAFYGIFYVGCDNGVMYAVNASTGSLAWEYDTTDPYVQGQAAAGDDAVYFLSQSDLAIGTIHAVECYGEAVTTTGVPTNDACDSDSEFDVDIDGWVNMTVSHADGVAVLATVDINVSTGDTGYFILRWNQTTNTFSEVEDSANLCTLNASSSARTNLNTTQDRISFYFRISVEANNGDMDVQATTIDDLAVSDTDTYYEEFTMNFYVDIVMTDSAFGWTGLDSGDGFVQLNSDGGSDGYVNYTVSTNDYAYITIKANAENLVSGENTIACGAIQYYDHGSVLRTLTTSYAHLVSVIGPVSESACAFDMYITVPENTPKGTYTLSITINGEQD